MIVAGVLIGLVAILLAALNAMNGQWAWMALDCVILLVASTAVLVNYRRRQGDLVVEVGGTWMAHDMTTGDVKPVNETESGRLYHIVGVEGKCPDCGSIEGFYEGPSGGMSTNVFCANRACRSGFNVTPFSQGVGTCERIHQGDLERYPKPETGRSRQ